MISTPLLHSVLTVAFALFFVLMTTTSRGLAADEVRCGSKLSTARVLRIVLSGELHEARMFAGICDWFENEPWQVYFSATEWRPSAEVAAELSTSSDPREQLPGLLLVQRAIDGSIRLGYSRWGRAPLRHSEHHLSVPFPLNEVAVEELAQSMGSIVELQDSRWLAQGNLVPKSGAGATIVSRDARLAPENTRFVARRRRWGPQLAIGYRGIERGPEPFSNGLSVQLELPGEGIAWRSALVVGAGGWLAADKRIDDSLRLSLTGTTYTFGLALDRKFSRIYLRNGITFSAERTVARMSQVDEPSRLTAVPRGVSWRGFVELTMGVILPWEHWEVRFQGLLRGQLNASPYQVQVGEDREKLFAPRRVQPGAEFQLAYAWSE